MRPLAFYIISLFPCRTPLGATGTIEFIISWNMLFVKGDRDRAYLSLAAP
jgi:hypothetical protein